jgi:hypothetical protein
VRHAAEHGNDAQKRIAPLMLALLDENRAMTAEACRATYPDWDASIGLARKRDAARRGEN